VTENPQGTKIGCIEEVAYRMGFINETQLLQQADALSKSVYAKYLQSVVNDVR
jgi:glucose-1-phosphate thymidylyltransferase